MEKEEDKDVIVDHKFGFERNLERGRVQVPKITCLSYWCFNFYIPIYCRSVLVHMTYFSLRFSFPPQPSVLAPQPSYIFDNGPGARSSEAGFPVRPVLCKQYNISYLVEINGSTTYSR